MSNTSSIMMPQEQQLNYENLALLFHREPPYPFRPRKGNELDEKLYQTLRKLNSKIPVSHIHKNLYLIGCNRLNCDSKFGLIFVKVGGGSQKLEDYLAKNEFGMRKSLVDFMIKHQLELHQVVNELKSDKKLAKGVHRTNTITANANNMGLYD